MTFVDGAAITGSQLNVHLRGNLLETAVAKATVAGSHFVATGPNSLAERLIAYPFVGATETTTLTGFDDLPGGTVGPVLAATASSRVIIMITAFVANNTVNANSSMGVDMSAPTSTTPTDAFALRLTSSTANASSICSYAAGLTAAAGATTYTCKYKVSSGTGTFANRRLTVMPL